MQSFSSCQRHVDCAIIFVQYEALKYIKDNFYTKTLKKKHNIQTIATVYQLVIYYTIYMHHVLKIHQYLSQVKYLSIVIKIQINNFCNNEWGSSILYNPTQIMFCVLFFPVGIEYSNPLEMLCSVFPVGIKCHRQMKAQCRDRHRSTAYCVWYVFGPFGKSTMADDWGLLGDSGLWTMTRHFWWNPNKTHLGGGGVEERAEDDTEIFFKISISQFWKLSIGTIPNTVFVIWIRQISSKITK